MEISSSGGVKPQDNQTVNLQSDQGIDKSTVTVKVTKETTTDQVKDEVKTAEEESTTTIIPTKINKPTDIPAPTTTTLETSIKELNGLVDQIKSNPCFEPSFLVAYTQLLMEMAKVMMEGGFKQSNMAIKMIALTNEISKTISSFILSSAAVKSASEIAQGVSALVGAMIDVGSFAVKFAASKAYAKNEAKNELQKQKNREISAENKLDLANKELGRCEKDFIVPKNDGTSGGKYGELELTYKGKKIDIEKDGGTVGQLKAKEYNAALDKRQEFINSKAQAKANFDDAKTDREHFENNMAGYETRLMNEYANTRGFDAFSGAAKGLNQAVGSFVQSGFTLAQGQIDSMKQLFEGYAQQASKMQDKFDSSASKAREGFAAILDLLQRISSILKDTFSLKG